MIQTANTPLLRHPDTEPLVPCKLYVRLYHGRNDPTEQLDDWGFDGPTFGPLSGVVSTYCTTIRLHGESNDAELWLTVIDDLIEWDGKFYGDWEVFIAPTNSRI